MNVIKTIILSMICFILILSIGTHVFGMGVTILFYLFFIFLVPITLWGIIGGLITKNKNRTLFHLTILFSLILPLYIVKKINLHKTKESIRIAEVIITALENYKSAYADYPENLSQLIPKFINEIPSTKMGIIKHSQFFYFKGHPNFHFFIPEPLSYRCHYWNDEKEWHRHQ